MHRVRFCRLLLLSLLLFPWARLPAASMDGRQDRRKFETAVREAFLKEDYALLEATVGELRAKKDRFPEGIWTLSVFYSALETSHLPLSAVRELEARLGRWQASQPGSVAVHLVRSQALRESDWGRVEGEAKTPREARLARAQAELNAAAGPGVTPPGPDWFAESLRVAWRVKAPRAEFEALYDRAVAAEPGYLTLHFVKASYLRMYGGVGAWQAFAREAGQKNLSGEGMGLYSRIVWSQSELYSDGAIFRSPNVEWPRMRDGFRELDRAWPDSEWNLNNFCRFACLAGDRATARELFARIGDRWTTNWLSHEAFEGWRAWAAADVDPLATPAVRLRPPAPEAGRQLEGYSVVFAADGQSVFSGYGYGRIARHDAGTGGIRWQAQLGVGDVHSLALSPDGRTLAAGTADVRVSGFVGAVGLWDLPAAGEPASAPTHRLGAGGRGGVLSLRWAPDGKSLAGAGGSYLNNFGEGWLWEMPGGREIRHSAEWDQVLQAVTFLSPDGQRLVQASGLGFSVIEAATGKKIFSPDYRMHTNAVRGLALSPDGKTLACATAAPFMERDRPAEVAFWDTATWTRRPVPGIAHVSGIHSLAWSADGRWLLGGGADGFLRVWDAATGQLAQSWPPEPGSGQIKSVDWSPDGRRVAVMHSRGVGLIHVFASPPATR